MLLKVKLALVKMNIQYPPYIPTGRYVVLNFITFFLP